MLPGKGYHTLQEAVMIGGGNQGHAEKKLLQCYFVNQESHIKSSSTECKAVQ